MWGRSLIFRPVKCFEFAAIQCKSAVCTARAIDDRPYDFYRYMCAINYDLNGMSYDAVPYDGV